MNGDIYAVKIPLEQLSEIVGTEILKPEPLDSFDNEDQAYWHGDDLKSCIDSINWVFERFNYAFDWKDFYVWFERGQYDDEPKDDKKYVQWITDILLCKAGDLSESKYTALKSLKFKKYTVKEQNKMFAVFDRMDDALNLNKYYNLEIKK